MVYFIRSRVYLKCQIVMAYTQECISAMLCILFNFYENFCNVLDFSGSKFMLSEYKYSAKKSLREKFMYDCSGIHIAL